MPRGEPSVCCGGCLRASREQREERQNRQMERGLRQARQAVRTGTEERKRGLGGAAARRPAANCQTTPAVPQTIPVRRWSFPMIKTPGSISMNTRARALTLSRMRAETDFTSRRDTRRRRVEGERGNRHGIGYVCSAMRYASASGTKNLACTRRSDPRQRGEVRENQPHVSGVAPEEKRNIRGRSDDEKG